jgi:hypothetical protein
MLCLLHVVTYFHKTVLEGGEWKILKMKGGLNQKILGIPDITITEFSGNGQI